MKTTFRLLAALVMMTDATETFAQNANSRIVTTITTQKHGTSTSLGRDFWLAPASPGTNSPGEYIKIYISSTSSTTAFVAAHGITKGVPVPAYGIGSYTLPLSWVMNSSGVVENNGIHVYSNDASISVYFAVHGPYGGDGTCCIPTVDWGRDYVVAAYESLYEGLGGFVYDEPSEFTISASLDSTIIQITPSCDLRLAAVYPDSDSIVAFQKGQTFSVTLNRGQSVQYQAVRATDTVGFDVTGTIIHANHPVGVVGGSMCSNIPAGFPYCVYITEMIPPTRKWGETYYTGGFAQPQGATGHDFSMYLFVSSVRNQTIYRYNFSTGIHTEAVLGPAFDHAFIEESGANKFYSSAPFLLMQYVNSSTYPDSVNGEGAPSELAIPAKEYYGKSAIFITGLVGTGMQSPYDGYADIITNVNDHKVTFDGKNLSSYTRIPIDDTFEVYIIPHTAPGEAHNITSDSGVAAYAYAYATDEAFSWGGSSEASASNSLDTFSPVAIASSQCFSSSIHVIDSGFLPGSTTERQSGLSELLIDSESNVTYQLDSNWFAAAPFDTSGYSMTVIDETKPAVLAVTVLDNAGNSTAVTSRYTPEFSFSDVDFGTLLWKGTKQTRSFDVTDTASSDLIIYSLQLTPGGKYNSSYSFVTSPPLPDTLKPGQTITIFITFDPSVSTDPLQSAQLAFLSDACNSLTVNLSASVSGAGVAEEITASPSASIVQLNDGKSIRIIIPSDWPPAVRLDIYNILGETVYSTSLDGTTTFDLNALTRGVYFYRLRSGETSQTGKILLGQ
jgi:hypothetical protein